MFQKKNKKAEKCNPNFTSPPVTTNVSIHFSNGYVETFNVVESKYDTIAKYYKLLNGTERIVPLYQVLYIDED